MNPIDICKRNSNVAKKRMANDRVAKKEKALELKTRHPWITDKAGEIREVFGGFVGMRIYEEGELKWEWKDE